LPLLLQYDSTADENETNESHGVGARVQIAKNLHAVHAAQALSKLCGLGGDGISSPSNLPAFNTLRALLTPRLADMLRNYPPKDLLSNLNSNLESPEVSCSVFNNIILNAQPKHCHNVVTGSKCFVHMYLIFNPQHNH
jgi:DnaJ family protein C protein 13